MCHTVLKEIKKKENNNSDLQLFFFSGEVISNLRDLQSLSFDTSAEKEKQKAEVKHILQQKQRALSDLFKMLTEIGEVSLLHSEV